MFAELIEWVMNLDREFAFLLALPFVVAVAGILAERMRAHDRREKSRPASRDVRVGHIGRAPIHGS
jgi:hypothetical protein